ncbi:MAG: transposase, partial [Acidimicrobiaceae bacterium]|nr:transposase [Acidimicrobiaceae bacterium]
MRALEPEVFDAVWEAVRWLLPPPDRSHPLGCHRPRILDEVCFRGLMIRLVTGASWVDVEAIMGFEVSDTTLRARRDEWIAAGVFDQLCAEALEAFDRVVGLDLSEVAVDGSLQKAPCGGEGTGPNPTDRAKMGWKWSVASDRHGVPVGWATAGANRNDVRLLEPTLQAVARNRLLADIETLHLDRGYDYPAVRDRLAALGLRDVNLFGEPGHDSGGGVSLAAVGEAVGSSDVRRGLRGAPAGALLAVSALLAVLGLGAPDARAQTDGVTVSTASLTLTELGGASAEATYTVVLATDPTADVTITVASDDPAVTVDTDSVAEGDQATLTFTHGSSGDWATAQTVTVRAANDGNIGSETATISHTATAASGPYDGITVASVSVAVTDAGAGFVISKAAVTVSEDGSTTTDTYTVTFKSRPAARVKVEVAPSETGAIELDGPDGNDMYTQSEVINIPRSAWQQAQTIKVRGIPDNIDKDTRSITISHTVTQSDGGSYPTDLTIDSVTASVTDDDTAGVTISKSTVTVSEDGTTTTDSYTVVLDSEPTRSVSVLVTAGTGAEIDGPDSSMAFTASETLTFTTSNWDTAQTVRVRGTDDDVDNPNDRRTVSITNNPSSSDAKYNAVATQTVAATVTDDDTAGVTISKTEVTVAEDGGTATYTVVLDSKPTSQVLIRVASNTESAAKLTVPDDSTQRTNQTLTFLAANWNVAQTVTVHGQNDDVDNSGDKRTATISHSSSPSSDTTYRALTISDTVAVDVTDDETAGVTVSRTAVTTAEGFANGIYTVKLNSRPTRIVNVTVTSSDNTVAGVDGPDVSGNYTASETLTFTTSNWGSAKTVYVYGRPDRIDNPNNKRTATVTHSSSSSDPKYNELTIGSVDVTVTDDDDPPMSVTLTATPATIAEDAAGTERNVVVKASVDGASRFGTAKTVNVTGARTAGTVDIGAITPFTITIPAAGDSGTHTVTLVPGNDVVDETDATVTFSGMLTGVTVNSGTVTVTDDDDTPTTIALSLSRTSMRENDATQAITVTATVQGTTTFGVEKTVTVSVAGSGQAGRVPFASVDDFDITIGVGARSATGSFNLDPTDNNRDETNETVTVSGSSGTLTVTSATATLIDDDAAPTGIALSVDDDAVSEGDAAQTITVTATVQGTTRYALAKTVTVSVAGSGDADVVGFTPVSNFDVTISAGADSGTNTFTLTPTDDSVDGYDETITVSGTASDVASITSDEIELSDDDDTTVTMSAPSGDVGEASGTKDVTLTLSRALVGAEAVTVSLTVVGAEAGTDYAFGLHPSAQTGVQILVSDPHSEQNPAVVLGTGASAAVLRFDPSNNSVRTQPWIVISHTVSSDNVDLADPVGGPVDFAITDDETGDIIVAGDWGLKPDALGPNSRFRLVFTTSGTRDASSGDIADYDAFVRGQLVEGNPDIVPYAGFFKALGSTSATDAVSHNGVGGNTAIGVYWLGGLTDAVAANYTVFRGEWSNQNRPRDEDGTLVSVESTGYFTGSLPDGTKSSNPLGSTNVRLGFLNDSGSGRAPLGNGTGGGATRSQSQQGRFYGLSPVFRVTTQPSVTIAADASSVTEGTAASFTVTATNAGQPVSADLSISLLVTADAAVVDPDNAGTKSVTVAVGTSTVAFTVPTIGDTVDEADEPVQVAVLSGTLYRAGDPSVAHVTVTDDDQTTLELALGAGIDSADPRINEGSTGALSLALGRTLATSERVTVPLTFAGTATRGTDYSLSCSGIGVTCDNLDAGNAQVVIAGGSSATITVSALPDAVHPETGESVDVGVGTPTAQGLSGGFATPVDNAGSIAIASLPPASVTASFASDAYTATEASASRSINARLNLSPAPASAVTIGYTVTGTAASGDDYTALSGTVSAAPGATFVDIAVTVINDNIDDDGETVVLTLTTSPLYNAGTNPTTTVTITDDDDAPSDIALSLSPAQIIEGDGPSAVTVTATVQGTTRFGVARTMSVSASRTSGTVDVEEITSFAITIPPGAQSAATSVTVTPTNDHVARQNAIVTFTGELAGVSVASTELTVAEDDITPTVIHLSVNPTLISEAATGSDRVVTVTATVQGASTFDTARTLSVRGTKTSGGVAVANTAQAPLTIPAGARSASITLTVAPTNDNRDDANTQFTISGPQIV